MGEKFKTTDIYSDHRVPWFAKVFTASIVAYAFSPIDLIPDFIPILGYLDEVVLLPFGIMLVEDDTKRCII
ncbi:YkvA family protein [Neobacillus rhizophilus]|uniref:YkvA family protein n=1 Tax=Neobacillus rhizophilus TaxID=2833579 RepID=UPI003555F396